MRSSKRVVPLLALLALTAAGCSNASSTGTASKTNAASGASSSQFVKKSPLKVGYSVFDLKQPYFQLYARGIKDEAKKLGWQYAESDQKSSEQAQVSGSADLINQGISALIVSPIQPDALPATITQAHAAKIPIVIGDVGAVGNYDTFVLSNNFEGGVQAAQYMVKQLSGRPGTKEVGVIELDPGIVVGKQRVQGFTQEIAKHSGFKIVASLNGKNTTEGAFAVAKNILSGHPKLAGFFTANDPMGAGASQVLKQAGKHGGANGVVLVSFNGDPPALDLVLSGDMDATIAQDPYGQGLAAMDSAAALVDGKAPKFTKAAEKTIEYKVILVTKENAQALKDHNASLLGG
jgi:ribose transport system substrate-binding protein